MYTSFLIDPANLKMVKDEDSEILHHHSSVFFFFLDKQPGVWIYSILWLPTSAHHPKEGGEVELMTGITRGCFGTGFFRRGYQSGGPTTAGWMCFAEEVLWPESPKGCCQTVGCFVLSFGLGGGAFWWCWRSGCVGFGERRSRSRLGDFVIEWRSRGAYCVLSCWECRRRGWGWGLNRSGRVCWWM